MYVLTLTLLLAGNPGPPVKIPFNTLPECEAAGKAAAVYAPQRVPVTLQATCEPLELL